MNNYWVGVIVGACFSSLFFTTLLLIVIDQNQKLKNQVLNKLDYVEKKVDEHSEVLDYFGWLKKVQEEEK